MISRLQEVNPLVAHQIDDALLLCQPPVLISTHELRNKLLGWNDPDTLIFAEFEKMVIAGNNERGFANQSALDEFVIFRVSRDDMQYAGNFDAFRVTANIGENRLNSIFRKLELSA